MTKTTKIITLILGLTLIIGTSLFVFADTNFLSSGRFEYKSDPNATDPDVILDARDFSTIYTEVLDGKTAIANKINELTEDDTTVSADVNNLPTFEELTDAMDHVYEAGYNKASEEMVDKLLTLQVKVDVPVANSIFDKTPATGTFEVRYGIDGVGTTSWTGNISQSSGSYGTQTRITSAQFTILGKNKYRCVMYGVMSQSAWADGYEDYGNEVSFTYTTTYDNGTATWSLSSSRLRGSDTVKGNQNDHYFYIKGEPVWTVPDWD